MNEDTNVQDKPVEGKPEPELHTETKPTEEVEEKSRTAEQFEKLTAKNKELSEKLASYEQKTTKESVLDSLTPKQVSEQPNPVSQGFNPSYNFGLQPKEDNDSIVDSEGYVNATLLTKKLKEAEERAKRAEEQSKLAMSSIKETEKQRQTKLAHKKYPQLDPHSASFDPKFYTLVKNDLIGQMMEGKQDLLAAAENMASIYNLNKPAEEAEAKKNEVAEQKAQIKAGSTQKVSASYEDVNENELAARTRKGDRNALVERLRRAGY